MCTKDCIVVKRSKRRIYNPKYIRIQVKQKNCHYAMVKKLEESEKKSEKRSKGLVWLEFEKEVSKLKLVSQ